MAEFDRISENLNFSITRVQVDQLRGLSPFYILGNIYRCRYCTRAKLGVQRDAGRNTYLNAMVRAVGHDDGVVRADREASRPGKASGFAPPHPELKQLPPLQQVMTPPTIAGTD